MQNTIKIIREALAEPRRRVAASGMVPEGTGALPTASVGEEPLYDDREVRAICDLLLEEVCGITRADRILHPDRVLPDEQRERLLQMAQQLREGVPVQQALGYEWFCGARFEVTPDVLIPRPETAELVDWIVTSARNRKRHADSVASSTAGIDTAEGGFTRICDIGTGSGCIALSLARLIGGAEVLAVDISEAALDVARRNACRQGIDNVQFVQCDILAEADAADGEPEPGATDVMASELSSLDGAAFDLIVSNPPYICRREASEMSRNVLQYEPDGALFVPDDDPLLFYRAIARFGRRHLHPGGELYFEINAAYGRETCALLASLGYADVELRQDINGRDRMVRAFNL